MRADVERAIQQTAEVAPLDIRARRSSADQAVALWVEEVCWRAHLAGCLLRRPPWWQRRERRQWREDRDALAAAGDLLQQQADALRAKNSSTPPEGDDQHDRG